MRWEVVELALGANLASEGSFGLIVRYALSSVAPGQAKAGDGGTGLCPSKLASMASSNLVCIRRTTPYTHTNLKLGQHNHTHLSRTHLRCAFQHQLDTKTSQQHGCHVQ